jgi:CBS domain-containing protein
MALTVRDVMDADPVSVTPDTPVQDVVRILRENELNGLPVVNEGGRCIGIITENDLVMAGDEGDLHLPHFIELFGGIVFLESLHKFEERLQRATASTAKDMMTEDPVVIGPGETLQVAGRAMAHSGHNRLPVVEHGRLVGMVTRVDVLDGLTRED